MNVNIRDVNIGERIVIEFGSDTEPSKYIGIVEHKFSDACKIRFLDENHDRFYTFRILDENAVIERRVLNIPELQKEIHEKNLKVGWWDNPRSFATFVCLFHSELSEALEGDRKSLPDDKLPHYPMIQVEIADFVIRCLDWLGHVSYNGLTEKQFRDQFNSNLQGTFHEFLASCHKCVSDAFTRDFEGDLHMRDTIIFGSVVMCFMYSENNGFDLLQIIDEKLAFNLTRADHQRENRQGEVGQKRY